VIRRSPEVLNLRVGEIVEVRSEEEILATLDSNGTLDELPFMPEMLQFCGKRFRVYKSALKLCDTICWTSMHRMDNAVHLENLRCDGQSHGGCQATCLIYWKEAWLRRVRDDPADGAAMPATGVVREDLGRSCTRDTLMAATRVHAPINGTTGEDGPERFSCQATQLMRAAPERLPWWNLGQYARDVRVGNVSVLNTLRSLAIEVFNKFQAANRRFFPRVLLIRGAQRYPFLRGELSRTPKEVLSLQPGELVEVKSKEEILATLDKNNKNRGLSFDVEMLHYCGRRARVLRRVDRVIDEKTGRMIHIKGDCIILENFTCTGHYYHYCPRGTYPYWREIWLKRVE
jgi:hypothetical protein